jgi:hypothetical protein
VVISDNRSGTESGSSCTKNRQERDAYLYTDKVQVDEDFQVCFHRLKTGK